MAEQNGLGAALITTLGTVATTALVVFGGDGDGAPRDDDEGFLSGTTGVVVIVGAAILAVFLLRK